LREVLVSVTYRKNLRNNESVADGGKTSTLQNNNIPRVHVLSDEVIRRVLV
jgi:hypothetical protein